MSNILAYLADEQGYYSHLDYDPTKNSLKIEIDTHYHKGSDGHIRSWSREEIDTVNNAIQEGLRVEINITRDACLRLKKMFMHQPEPSSYSERRTLEGFKESINRAIRLDCEYRSCTTPADGSLRPEKGQVFTQRVLDTLVRRHRRRRELDPLFLEEPHELVAL